jgi:hypothetical protein
MSSPVPSFRQMVAAFFKARPNEWIDAVALEGVGGRQAWRTRVSECRRQGMNIENRVRRERNVIGDGYTVSEYRYVPEATA